MVYQTYVNEVSNDIAGIRELTLLEANVNVKGKLQFKFYWHMYKLGTLPIKFKVRYIVV